MNAASRRGGSDAPSHSGAISASDAYAAARRAMSLRGNKQNKTRSIATRFSNSPLSSGVAPGGALSALPELGQPVLNAARQIGGPLGRRQRHAPQDGRGNSLGLGWFELPGVARG